MSVLKGDAYEIELNDPLYPTMVGDLNKPPQRLYVMGDPSILGRPSLSIIGARKATPYGKSLSGIAARLAIESGLNVVSGAALGCDQAAGWSAVRGGGVHVAVLGTGADIPYPRSARGLLEETLSGGGAVISLEPWGTPPQRWAFPKRNQIIAALSQALFISEAGMPSGTFSTAEAAIDLGREVLVAPGSIFAPESRGSNYLISNGACCIADIESLEVAISRIYGALRFQRAQLPGRSVSSQSERKVMEMLSACPMRAEEIAKELRLSATELNCLFGSLEYDGSITRLTDGRYSLSEAALYESAGMRQNT